MASITVSDISKAFSGQPILRDVSLDIRDGEFLSLVGPSGCGKSTLLRIIAGLEEQDHGSVEIGGRSVDAERPGRRDVAMVFQSYALYPHLSVYDNMAAPLRQRSLTQFQRGFGLARLLPKARRKEAEFRREIEATATMLGISGLLQRKPAQLSGGQRQRVALGRAIVRHPKAFLMDEPLSNLDAKLRDTVRAEISALHRRLGATFLYVTHDQAEAMTMSDRIAIIMEGQVLQIGAPSDVYHDPADLRVARFIGSPRINVLAGEIDGSGRAVLLGRAFDLDIAPPAHGKVQLAFRPHDAGLCNADTAQLVGTISHIENLGSDILIHLALPGSEEPVIIRESHETAIHRRLGDSVGLKLDSKKLLVFDETTGKRLRTPAQTETAS
ncbi:ABC transporter ATP-binding protein [Neorhizobium alkalisoli]|uniref:Carbohydrate ABC transporter ATP-binding protein (CUT1 family) n=1 Tax=Neorhizobium alkalisoli TaxID=528178 RepID=A0A561Q0W0_9HYPH|nr:ABC transporter ATP-binding protein [Neorhizobium alkalisoli]TWF44011.1 carbohydrate ABC transporter ATP-binding protein (CUT1 family) [Neorhizobium alkalisoli]